MPFVLPRCWIHASVVLFTVFCPRGWAGNIVPNGDFEQGALYWNFYTSQALASSEVNPENVRSGQGSLEIYRQSSIYEGLTFTGTLRTIINPAFPTDPGKDTSANDKSPLLSRLQAEGTGNYTISAYVKTASGNSNARFSFQVKSNGTWGTQYSTTPVAVNSTGWTLVRATLTNVTWTNSIEDLTFKLTLNPAIRFYVDDVSIEKVGSTPDPTPPPRPVHDTARIENWKGGATAACSLTADDGTDSQRTVLLPILDQHGFKATFFHYRANYKGFFQWGGVDPANWVPVFAAGHEFGSHGITHVSPTGLTEEEARFQLGESKAFYKQLYGLSEIYVFATPFATGKYAPRQSLSIMAEYYSANRGASWIFSDPGGEGIVPLLNHDPVSLPSLYWEGSSNKVQDPVYPWLNATSTAAHGNAWIDRVIAKRAWGIETIHGVVTDPAQATGVNVHRDTYAAHFAYLAEHRDAGRLWVAPMGEVARYDRARKASSVSQTEPANNQFTLRLDTGAMPANSLPAVPLTLSFALPSGWTAVEVRDGGQTLPVSIRAGRVLFDVTPAVDGSKILTVSRASTNPSEALNLWRQSHFGTTVSTGAAADTGDPDGDGHPNLVEYALGTDPTLREPGVLSALSVETAGPHHHLTLTVQRNGTPAGVTCSAEVSSDLSRWESNVTVLEDLPTRFRARDNAPLGTDPRFIRLRASLGQ